MDIVERMLRAEIASCTCVTKTNVPKYHADNCLYGILATARLELLAGRADREELIEDESRAVHRCVAAETALASAAPDAKRYQWLRDHKHLDIWWSVDGPKDRCENIDGDIDAAMTEAAARG